MPIKQLDIDFSPKIDRLKILTKKFVIGNISSLYTTAIKGQGLEFDGYREYSINDDAKQIDWKATLRSQNVLVKKFIEERNLNVFFLFDTSNSMLFSSTGKLKAEFAAELIAAFAFIVLHNQDYVGLSMFTDKILNRLNLGQGTRQFFRLSSELSNVNNYGGKFDLVTALKLVFQFLRKRAILVLVSDFIGLKGEEWKTYVDVAAQKYDLLPIMIRDPEDREFPPDANPVIIEDPYSDEQIIINPDQIRQEYVDSVFDQEIRIAQSFQKVGVKLLSIQSDQDFVEPLAKYFSERIQSI